MRPAIERARASAGSVAGAAAFAPTRLRLRCLGCGKTFADGDHRLACDEPHPPALLRALYAVRQLRPRDGESGVLRWADWLPARAHLDHVGAPAVYRSEGLARALGLASLWIAFSGYWPERGATLRTTSFKELEAPVVCSRLGSDRRTLVVASAGNTARAFLEVCSRSGQPLLVVVPQSAVPSLWTLTPPGPNVRVVAVAGGDYLDAIRVAGWIAAIDGFVSEGGVRNVARRDGLGTPVLAAAHAIGRIPEHYVQAVGSGSGGIAAWEAAMRLGADGRFGSTTMRLHLAQNLPFAPMVDAFARGDSELHPLDEAEARRRIDAIDAGVLANRAPPYGLPGGVRDALHVTRGAMYGVDNAAARAAAALVERTEGIDVDPAAAVAAAALAQAVTRGAIPRAETVLLHLTGGGRRRLAADHHVHRIEPTVVLGQRPDLQNQVWERFAPHGGI